MNPLFSQELKKDFTRFACVSLILHLITAWFSAAYHQIDEHFQILEFVNYKLGLSTTQNLPWEYHEKLRSWLLPYFYLGIAHCEQFLGIESPLAWATSFRIVTALISWSASLIIALEIPQWIQGIRWQRLAMIFLFVLWFFPYIHARTTGENLGGSLFFLGLALLFHYRESTKWFFIAGLLLGFAFQIRFQIGFMIFGLTLWMLFFNRPKLRPFFGFTFGFLAVCALGMIADHAGYGLWVSTPWNYLYSNIIVGRVMDFGSLPWWEYFKMIAVALPPLSTLMLILSGIALFKYPKHVLTWITVPFLLIHCMISWKELRFLFPLATSFALLSVMGLQVVEDRFKLMRRPLVFAAIVLNIASLAWLGLRPAASTYSFYQHVLTHHSENFELFFASKDPYSDAALRYRYYEPKTYRYHSFERIEDMIAAIKVRTDESVYVFHDKMNFPEAYGVLAQACEIEFESQPHWLRRFNYQHRLDEKRWWVLYRCFPSKLR